jgi:hypothetical protein
MVIILVFSLSQISNFSQEKISLAVYQDAKLLFLGDNHRNKAGTMDLLTNIKLQGKQKQIGYPVYTIAYEQANLRVLFKRYSLGAGYTFNKMGYRNSFLNRLEITPTIGYGLIKRHRKKKIKTSHSWSFSTQISYQVTQKIKILFLNQLIRRTDIKQKKKKPKIVRYSAFFGVEFSLFKTSKSRATSCF